MAVGVLYQRSGYRLVLAGLDSVCGGESMGFPDERPECEVPMIDVVVDSAGWIGAAVLLAAYALVSAGRIPGRSVAFQALNLVGAAGLLANSAFHGAWPSSALNLIWLVLGLHAVARLPIGDTVEGPTSRVARPARTGHSSP